MISRPKHCSPKEAVLSLRLERHIRITQEKNTISERGNASFKTPAQQRTQQVEGSEAIGVCQDERRECES